MAVCLIAFFSSDCNAVPQQPVDQVKRVLVINSYHKGYPWTDSTLTGIESILKDGKQNMEVHVEYLDAKGVEDKGNYYRFFQHLKTKFSTIKFNLVLASDNDAVSFVLRYRNILFPNVPVVFCGVNSLHEVVQKRVPLMTGVIEHYDLKATLEVALKLHPEAKEVIAVNNATSIGAIKRRLFNEAVTTAGKSLKNTIIDDPVLADFERLIKEKKNCVVFLLGSFKDKSGAMVPIEESTPVLARYDVPLYAGIEHYLGFGVIGGKLIRGYSQGALAAQMGLKILQGEPVDKVPIEPKSPNVFMFDYNQMARFGINQAALPEGSVVINVPKTPVKNAAPQKHENNTMVWVAIAVFIGLALIVILLILYVRSRKAAEEVSDVLSVDIEKKVEARTDELMKANADLRTKIAEMKHAEASLSESHLRHWTLFQQAPNPVFLIDGDARFSDCNAKMIDFFECTLDELRNMDVRELIPGNVLTRLLEGPDQSALTMSIEAQRAVGGKIKKLMLNLVPVVLSGKRFVYGIGQDISSLKKEEDVLRAQEAFLRKVIDIMPGAVMISDRNGKVRFISEGLTRAIGYTIEDISTVDEWWGKVCPDRSQREMALGSWIRVVSLKETHGESIQSIESKVTTKDGTSIEKELRFINIQDMVAIVVQDVKDKKSPEAPVHVSRNQEPIETLAAGIAHDFNNLLLVILGNISLAKTGLSQTDRAFDRLIDAERASMMTKDLIQQLITFSKGGELSKRAMVITPLIMEITRSTISNTNVKGRYVMSDDLFPVEIDESQIRQVMHIILRNAREAMPQGGTVTISFENVKITHDDYLPLKDGDYVRISVQDEGAGIKEEHIARIFDPYFTTKDVGTQKGVGLGLAIAYSIIKKHNGHIAVESSLGGGTIFHIYLPAYGKEISIGKEAEETFIETTKRKGRILVMDDAKAVRDVTGAMLTHIGYDVEFARDGREAIALYRDAKEAGDPFDAVILDLAVQGGMGGKESMELLLSTDPHIRAVISSGYSGDPIMADYHNYGFKAAILKPYKMEELEEVLEKIISGLV